jgi:hypothetical protein
MVAEGAAGAVNIFSLDGPTATGSGLLRAAASFTAETTRGLSAGFDLQARFEGAVDAKLTDGVRASFRGSGSASVGAEASAYFPLDVFDFAGVVASLKAQAEARASIKLDIELRPHELVASVFTDTAGSLWRPYVDVVAGQVHARAGLYASAAVCVKATAETKAGIRLFPKAGEPAGTVFIINFGYGFIYGYSWGVLAELSFPEPAVLVRELFGVTTRQLAAALEAESTGSPEPMRSVLAEAADLVELVVPALAGMLCSLLADLPEADRQARLTTSATTLATQLGQHLLERLVSAAMDGLGTLLVRLGLPVGPDIGNTLLMLLHAVQDAVVAGRSALSVLPDAINAIVDALFELARQGLGDADRELLGDVVVGIWAGVSLLETEPGFTRPPTGALRQLLVEQGIDPTVGTPGDLPARALGRSAARLLRRAGAATWLSDVTGLVLEDLLRMPLRGIDRDPVQFLRSFLTAAGAALSRELLDELPLDDIGVPPEAVESVRSILQVAIEELPDLLDDLSDEQVLRRLRERVSVGLLQSVGPPLVSFLENVAQEGFAQAVPAIRRLEAQARDASDLIPQFPRGGPLERFTSALEDLGRESIDVTLGLPTSELLGHLAAKLDRWRTQRLPVELALMHETVGLQGQTSASLLAALDSSDTAVVLEALRALVEHHLDQIRSITQFLVEDSADLLVRLTTLPFEQAARLFAASVKFSFELTAAMIAQLSIIATDVDRRIDELQVAAARQVAELALQCARLARLAENAVDQVIDGIITDLVGNDPIARFAANLAFNALTGGIVPVVQRMLGDVSTVLRVAGESIAAAAQAGTLGAGGALSILDQAVRGTASQGVSIPITLLVPIFPPFFFANVTVATVSVPAEWLGLALWSAITGLAGVGPLITAIDDTARSLQLTNSALDAVRTLGTGDQIRRRAEELESRVSAAVLNQPITIAFDAGSPQSVTTAGASAIVTGRVSGIDRSYVVPMNLGDGARSTVIPARVRFTCQGVPVPPESVTWTDAGPGTLAFRFGIAARATEDLPGVVVHPGVCVVTALAAMGAWNGRSDDVGASRSLTLLLVPDPAEQGKHAVVEGWAGPDGTAHVAYLSPTSQTERALILLTRGIDGAWSADDVTTAAGAEAPSVGSGFTGWSGAAGDVHLVYTAAAGGLYALHRDGAGLWRTELLDDGGRRGFVRTGRPVRLDGDGERLAYVNERGQLRLAARAAPEVGWRITDLTTTAGVPPAAPATGLVHWETTATASNDLATEGNLLANPGFVDGPRNRWEHAASWTGWTQGRQDRVMLTDLQPSTLPIPGSRRMLHVSTTIDTAGLVQAFAPQDTGPQRVESAAWIYVLRGEVAIGTGNGGNTGYDARTTEQGRWIRLSAPNGVSPANEFIIYAASPGGAEFFVAAASVREPGARAGRTTTTNLAYGGADGHLYHLTQEPSSPTWQIADLTLLAQALPWRPGTDLTTWADYDGQRHVSFWGIDEQLYDLTGPETGSAWWVEQLNEPMPHFFSGRRHVTSSAATTWALGDVRGLVCTGPDGLVRIGTSVGGAGPWTWVEAATDRRAPSPLSRGALASWVDMTGTASAAMIGGDRRVYLLSGTPDGSDWTVTDLTAEASAPPAARPGG